MVGRIGFALMLLLFQVGIASSDDQLIENGGFEFGNIDFDSDYNFVMDGTGQPGPGSYGVTFDALVWNNQFTSFGGHSPLGGSMLVANSATIPGAAVWRQTFNVDPNSIYVFAVCAVNVSPGVDIDVVANGQAFVSIQLNGPTGNWEFFTTTWASEQNNSLTLEFINNNISAVDNDFALDNISLQQVVFGDLNGDCVVNLLDVQPFVKLISNAEFALEADINRDGVVNLLDVTPFIEILSGGN